MNEIKRAREQLDARNGLEPRKKKRKKLRLRIRRKKRPAAEKKSVRTAERSASARPERERKEPKRSRRREKRAADMTAPVRTERAAEEQSRKKGRRRRRKKNYILYYIILFILAATAGIILSLTVFFNISEISVEGTSRYTAEEIAASSGIEVGNNLFRISTGDAEARIVEQFVYVDSAAVERSFPDRLTIRIVEAKPVMALQRGSSYTLLSERGRILEESAASAPAGVVVVTGVDPGERKAGDFLFDSEEPSLDTLREVYDACRDKELGTVTRSDIRSISDIRITVDDRIRIDTGTAGDLDYKLTFAREIIKTQLGETDRGVIDVKEPGKAYYRPSATVGNA